MNSFGDDGTGQSDPRSQDVGGRGWVGIAVASLAFPILSVFLLAFTFIAVLGDPAVTLGISEALLNGVLVVLSGLLAGIMVGVIDQRRGLALLVPAVAGLVVGLTFYSAFSGFGRNGEFDFSGVAQIVTWLGVSAAIFITTQLSGYGMVGSVLAVSLVGAAAAVVVGSLPEAPVELVVVLESGYEIDEAAGTCWGVGELSELAEDTRLLLVNVNGEMGSVVLPVGSDDEGCVFELGDQLGLSPSEYSGLHVTFESGEPMSGGMSEDGNRVVFTTGSN
jgi:hypothetical protein